MSRKLREYEGAVNGVNVLHGLVVASNTGPQDLSHTAANADRESLRNALPVSLETVLQRAVEVIGARDEAMRWLGTPVRALNYATPISLLVDEAGSEQVLAVLTNLEHGVL